MTRSRSRRPAGRALRPADPSRHRVRGQDDPRCDVRRAGARASHRDPRLRQLLDQPAAAAHRPQPALGRAGASSRKSWCRTSSRARPCARRSTSASAHWRCEAAERPSARSPQIPPATSEPATMRYLVWLRPGSHLLHPVRVRAEQPARRDACTASSARPGARRWCCVVLAAFAARLRVRRASRMVPRWWRHRRMARTRSAAPTIGRRGAQPTRRRSPPQHPPRDGL